MGQFQNHLAEHWETVSVSILFQSFTGKIGWWRIISSISSSIHLSNVQGVCSSRSQLSGEQSWNGVETVCKMRKRCLYVVTFSRCSNRWFELVWRFFGRDLEHIVPTNCSVLLWMHMRESNNRQQRLIGTKVITNEVKPFLKSIIFFTNASSHLHPSCYIMCCCRLSVHY